MSYHDAVNILDLRRAGADMPQAVVDKALELTGDKELELTGDKELELTGDKEPEFSVADAMLELVLAK